MQGRLHSTHDQEESTEVTASAGRSGARGRGNQAAQERLRQRLPTDLRSRMERSFGADFSGVNVVLDDRAADHDAEAMAQGETLFFDPAEYDPGSPDGRELIAHELAHILQQRRGGAGGQAQESEADQQAARAAQGQAIDGAAQGPGMQGGRASGSTVQFRKKKKKKSTSQATQITQAKTWATGQKLAPEAIRALQTKLGVEVTGVYDDATAKAVLDLQKKSARNPKGPGQASRDLFDQLGLVFVNTVPNATVDDAMLDRVKRTFPNGITVSVMPDFKHANGNDREFYRVADDHAARYKSLGISGGALVFNQTNKVKNVGDVVEVINAIHRGLVDRWRASNEKKNAAAAGTDGSTPAETPEQAKTSAQSGKDTPDPSKPVDTSDAPAWTRVSNLAVFSHGMPWGLALNDSGHSFSKKGMRSVDKKKSGHTYQDNVQAFVDAVQGALAPGVRVQLYACNAGRDSGASETYAHWNDHTEGGRDGESSFAHTMQSALGADSTVYAHQTAGHTTENFSARVFGHDADSVNGTNDQGGAHIFELIYSSSFIQSELQRLFPELSEEDRTRRSASLRELMWAHFKDSINTEHKRSSSKKRYDRPMGMDMFADIEGARTRIQTDFQTWITSRKSQIREPGASRSRGRTRTTRSRRHTSRRGRRH